MKSNQKIYLLFSLLGVSLLGVILASFAYKGPAGKPVQQVDQEAADHESGLSDFRKLREKAYDFHYPSRPERVDQILLNYLSQSLTEYLKTKRKIEDLTEETVNKDYGLPEQSFEPGTPYHYGTIKVLPYGERRQLDGAIVYFSHDSPCLPGVLFFVNRSLQATLVGVPDGGGVYALYLKDLDNDGVQELIAETDSCGSGAGKTLNIFQYKGSTFEPIFKDQVSTFYKNKYEIVDIDDDGRFEVRERFAHFGIKGRNGERLITECNACEHVFEEVIFVLQNGKYQLAQRTFVASPYLTVSRFLKAIWDGDVATAYQYVQKETYPSLAAFQRQENDLITYGRKHKWDGANFWGEFEKRGGYYELDYYRFYVTKAEPYLITKIARR